MPNKIMNKLFDVLKRRKEDELQRLFGGIQQCPWCRQVAQSEEGWSFRCYEPDPHFDVLTCGVCGGTSKWMFLMGMIYFGPLDPPVPIPSDIAPIPSHIKPFKLDQNGTNPDKT